MCHVATRLIWVEYVLVMLGFHPYMEDYVVLLTRPAIRAEDRMIDHDINYKLAHEDTTTSRWCAST